MSGTNEQNGQSRADAPTEVYRWPAPDPAPERRPGADGPSWARDDTPTAVLDPEFGKPGASRPPSAAPATDFGGVRGSAAAGPEIVVPRPRGNRVAGIGIALLGTVVFGALALVVAVIARVVAETAAPASVVAGVESVLATLFGESVGASFAAAVVSPTVLVPVVAFFVALAVIVLVVNRAGWWAYVLGGFLVAVVVYAAGVLGSVMTRFGVDLGAAPSGELLTAVVSAAVDPAVVLTAVAAREVSVWTGAWIARRGRSVAARNRAAAISAIAGPDTQAGRGAVASSAAQPQPSSSSS